MSFTETLRAKHKLLWDQAVNHTFVKALADGSLPKEKFKFYLVQDAKFLVETARTIALAAAKESRSQQMLWLLGLAHETLAAERALHRDYLGSLGMSEQAITEAAWGQANAVYTKHLVDVASTSRPEETLCALLPCFWIYPTVGQSLLACGEPPADHPYRTWILQYGDPTLMQEAERIRAYVDAYINNTGKEPPFILRGSVVEPMDAESEKTRLEFLFAEGCRHEIDFWEMAWTS